MHGETKVASKMKSWSSWFYSHETKNDDSENRQAMTNKHEEVYNIYTYYIYTTRFNFASL